MAGIGDSWGTREELLHPRDSHGRFRSKWKMSESVLNAVLKITQSFQPRTFQSDGQARQYTQNLAHRKPGRFQGGRGYARFQADFANANEDLLDGNPDEPSTKKFVQMMDQSMIDLPDDVILSSVVPPAAFGLTPDRLPELEEMTGDIIANRGYFSSSIGTPLGGGNGNIAMHLAVPKGTRMAIPGRNPNDPEMVFDRDQEFTITKVKPDGRGGYSVSAVATPKTAGENPSPTTGHAGPGKPANREAEITALENNAMKRDMGEQGPGQLPGGAAAGETPSPSAPAPGVPAPAAPATGNAEADRAARRAQILGRPAGSNATPQAQREAAPAAPAPAAPAEPSAPPAPQAPATNVPETSAPQAPAVNVPEPPPAPEVPPTAVQPPNGATSVVTGNPATSFRDAVREADLQSPSDKTRRREWNNAFVGITSGKRHPEDTLRELESDIASNHAKQAENAQINDHDSVLGADIEKQEQLADLIRSHFNLGDAKQRQSRQEVRNELEAKAVKGFKAKVTRKSAVKEEGAKPAEADRLVPRKVAPPRKESLEERGKALDEQVGKDRQDDELNASQRQRWMDEVGPEPKSMRANDTAGNILLDETADLLRNGRVTRPKAVARLREHVRDDDTPEANYLRKVADAIEADSSKPNKRVPLKKAAPKAAPDVDAAEKKLAGRTEKNILTGLNGLSVGDLRALGDKWGVETRGEDKKLKLKSVLAKELAAKWKATPELQRKAEGAEGIEGAGPDLTKMTIAQLKEYAKEKGIKVPSGLLKKPLLEHIQKKDAAGPETTNVETPAAPAVPEAPAVPAKKVAKAAVKKAVTKALPTIPPQQVRDIEKLAGDYDERNKVAQEAWDAKANEVRAGWSDAIGPSPSGLDPVQETGLHLIAGGVASKKLSRPAAAKRVRSVAEGHPDDPYGDYLRKLADHLEAKPPKKVPAKKATKAAGVVEGTDYSDPALLKGEHPETIAHLLALGDTPEELAAMYVEDGLSPEIAKLLVNETIAALKAQGKMPVPKKFEPRKLTVTSAKSLWGMDSNDLRQILASPDFSEKQKSLVADELTRREESPPVAVIIGKEVAKVAESPETPAVLKKAAVKAVKKAAAPAAPQPTVAPEPPSTPEVPTAPERPKIKGIDTAERARMQARAREVLAEIQGRKQDPFDQIDTMLPEFKGKRELIQGIRDKIEKTSGPPGVSVDERVTAHLLARMTPEGRESILQEMSPADRKMVEGVAERVGLDRTRVKKSGHDLDRIMSDSGFKAPTDAATRVHYQAVKQLLAQGEVGKAEDVLRRAISGSDANLRGYREGLEMPGQTGANREFLGKRITEELARNDWATSVLAALKGGSASSPELATKKEVQRVIEIHSPELGKISAKQLKADAEAAGIKLPEGATTKDEIITELAREMIRRERAGNPIPLTPPAPVPVKKAVPRPTERIDARSLVPDADWNAGRRTSSGFLDHPDDEQMLENVQKALDGEAVAGLPKNATPAAIGRWLDRWTSSFGGPGSRVAVQTLSVDGAKRRLEQANTPEERAEAQDKLDDVLLEQLTLRQQSERWHRLADVLQSTRRKPVKKAAAPSPVAPQAVAPVAPVAPVKQVLARAAKSTPAAPTAKKLTPVPVPAATPRKRTTATQRADQSAAEDRSARGLRLMAGGGFREDRPSLVAKEVQQRLIKKEVQAEVEKALKTTTPETPVAPVAPVKAAKKAAPPLPTGEKRYTREELMDSENTSLGDIKDIEDARGIKRGSVARADRVQAILDQQEAAVAPPPAKKATKAASTAAAPRAAGPPLRSANVTTNSGIAARTRPNADEPIYLPNGGQDQGFMHLDSEMGQLWQDLYADDREPNSFINEIARMGDEMGKNDLGEAEVIKRLRAMQTRATDKTIADRIGQTADKMDAPPVQLEFPEGTPVPLQDLIRKLAEIPTARKRSLKGERVGTGRLTDKSVVDRKMDIIRKIASGGYRRSFEAEHDLGVRDYHEGVDAATSMWSVLEKGLARNHTTFRQSASGKAEAEETPNLEAREIMAWIKEQVTKKRGE